MNEETEELSHSNLEQLIEQRNSLFKKAMEAKGTHMQVRSCVFYSSYNDTLSDPVSSSDKVTLMSLIQGIRSYYSAQARELNSVIKASQKEKQLEMFIDANKRCPSTR